MGPLAFTILPLLAASAPDCAELYHGIGRPADPAAARRCLERSVPVRCDGPVDLPRAELAVMYLDGQGGAADPARGWAILEGCAPDRTLFELRRTFATRLPTGTYSLCASGVTAPSVFRACYAIEASLAGEARLAAARRVRAGLPRAARGSLDAAEAAWSRFLEAEIERVAKRVRTPDAAPLVRSTIIATREQDRSAWLERAPGLEATPCPPGDEDEVEARLRWSYGDAASDLGPDALSSLAASQVAWAAFRDAELRWIRAGRDAAVTSRAACELSRMRGRMLEVHER
jgi:uncharacterized protein YecT (DUF1311 family)